jgi:O-6-methylguanine DNA methyltransferase
MATPCCCVAMCSERPHGHAKAKRDHATHAHPTVNRLKPAAKKIAARAEREIREYLAGRRRRFTVPLDLSGLSPFHRRVLRAALRIPYGRTVTYSDLARRVGRPAAARAVGQAMARNPVPLVIPCHRVVAAGGGLGGYSGGLALKRRLLALEGAAWIARD